MIGLIKDRINLSLIMAVLFFLGMIVSIYSIYSLPHTLMLSDGYQPVFTNVYLILTTTFLLGALTIWYTIRHKNEIIVYRDKQIDKTDTNNDNNESSKTTISLESVKNNISQAKNQKDLLQTGLHAICKQLEAGQGAIYLTKHEGNIRKVEMQAGYAMSMGESSTISFEFGEGLVGQAAAGGSTLYIDEIPEGYVKIISGLGSASPKYLLITPLKNNNGTAGVIEIASFVPITEDQRKFVEESAQLVTNSLSGN